MWHPVRFHILIITLCLFAASPYRPASAQDRARGDKGQSQEIVILERKINDLGSTQRQILDQLDELKKLLQATGQPIPPQPPRTLDIHGEDFRGNPGAHVAIIEYADFECPYCGEYEHKVFPHLLSDYIQTGKVKYFYRDLPLSIHGRALPAARAARCAGEQGKYWEMHDSLFAKQNALSAPALLERAQTLGLDKEKFTECLSSDRYNEDIRKSISDAEKFGIDGTPTFFIGTIEGDVVNIKAGIKGTSPVDVFKTDLDALLPTNGQESVSAH
jgi:protein-disulfide isomerase